MTARRDAHTHIYMYIWFTALGSCWIPSGLVVMIVVEERAQTERTLVDLLVNMFVRSASVLQL